MRRVHARAFGEPKRSENLGVSFPGGQDAPGLWLPLSAWPVFRRAHRSELTHALAGEATARAGSGPARERGIRTLFLAPIAPQNVSSRRAGLARQRIQQHSQRVSVESMCHRQSRSFTFAQVQRFSVRRDAHWIRHRPDMACYDSPRRPCGLLRRYRCLVVRSIGDPFEHRCSRIGTAIAWSACGSRTGLAAGTRGELLRTETVRPQVPHQWRSVQALS